MFATKVAFTILLNSEYLLVITVRLINGHFFNEKYESINASYVYRDQEQALSFKQETLGKHNPLLSILELAEGVRYNA